MNKLTLAEVMQSQTVTPNGDGYRMTNAAGTADYDSDGQRTHVNGVPEYFPLKLGIEVKPESETRWIIFNDGDTRITDAKGETLCRFGYLGDNDKHEPHKDIDRVAQEILSNANSNEQDMRQLRAGGAVNSNKTGLMGEAPLQDGQVFIKDALIQPSAIMSASTENGKTTYRATMSIGTESTEPKTSELEVREIIRQQSRPGGIIYSAIECHRGAGNW